MAFRPHHTCFLLLGIVLVLTILDCFILSSYPTRLTFAESETCEKETTVSLPQTEPKIKEDRGDDSALVQRSEVNGYRWSYYICGPGDQDFPKQKIHTPAKVPSEDDMMAAESEFTLDTKETATSFQCISGVTRCRHADMLDEETIRDAAVTLEPKQYLIQLEEERVSAFPSRILVLLCFGLILAGLFYGWHHNESMPKPGYSTYNGIEAFFVATFLGIALGQVIYSFMPQGDGNMVPLFTTSMANLGMFVGLFATAGFFIFLKTKKPYRDDSGNGVCQTDDDADGDADLPFFCISPMKWALFFGFILAVIAAIFALKFNDIEMTIGDLSNEFTSYRLSLMHFAMIAGVSEELLYRGVIQTAIGGRKRRGVRAMVGVWVAALLFAAVHIPQSLGHLFTLLPVFMVGLTSGYFRCKTQSIFPSMTMHLTYNSILMLPFLFFI